MLLQVSNVNSVPRIFTKFCFSYPNTELNTLYIIILIQLSVTQCLPIPNAEKLHDNVSDRHIINHLFKVSSTFSNCPGISQIARNDFASLLQCIFLTAILNSPETYFPHTFTLFAFGCALIGCTRLIDTFPFVRNFSEEQLMAIQVQRENLQLINCPQLQLSAKTRSGYC
ncbi:hypothetical protein T4B_526 [Trichinella pseudospiralis]|uniref:Uncharacterized protein n=1 Tax=Trichinella pseudospiralis TaxID=6337 RepID=A0A0V1E967_TRIPS|nr:hypothetical protein T4A_7579 [Trichinella pseudospiralis]KRZ10306.1 hypothetical protein T4B_526 [Trichinella pseudospiralis]